jgi:hypothetical protein
MRHLNGPKSKRDQVVASKELLNLALISSPLIRLMTTIALNKGSARKSNAPAR